MKKNKTKIKGMFNTISKEYDMLNNIITFGQHKNWKSKIFKLAESKNPKLILDLATGTADIAILSAKLKNCKVIGLDISKKMLSIGQKKIDNLCLNEKIKLELGDAECINYKDGFFDMITIGYGVRNFENLENGLNECKRVLKNSGCMIILETSVPRNKIIKFFYMIYTTYFIHLIGKIFSKQPSAYKYLHKSSNTFPSGKNFEKILSKIGFKNIISYELLFGASSIYIAEK